MVPLRYQWGSTLCRVGACCIPSTYSIQSFHGIFYILTGSIYGSTVCVYIYYIHINNRKSEEEVCGRELFRMCVLERG